MVQGAAGTPAARAAGQAQVKLVGNSPKVELAATQEFYDLADRAQKRFWVLSPYLGDQRMIGKLVETAQRGVDVRLAVPGPNPWKNGKFALRLTRSFYPQLVNGGVKVYEQPQMSHSKLWLSDDIANISSVNLDHHSSHMDYEIGATIQDPKFLGQVEGLFARDFGRSRPIGVEEANSHRTIEKVRNIIGLDV
jgi:phosphatidylserine/phosphatidylglycerophosphate/cardiolipin synthase-like enzyme